MTGGEYKKKKRKTDVSSTIISPRKKKIGSDDIITWQWNIPGIGTAKDTQRNKKKEEGCCRWASFAASGLVHCACLALTIITFIPLLYLFLAPTVSSFSPFLFRSPSSCLPWCEHDIKKHSGTSGLLWRCDLKREEGKAQAESQCSSVVFRSYDSSNSGHVYIFILGKTLSLISFFLFFFLSLLVLMGLPIVLSTLEPALERRNFSFSSFLSTVLEAFFLLYCTHYLDGVDDILSLVSIIDTLLSISWFTQTCSLSGAQQRHAQSPSLLQLQSLSRCCDLTRHGRLWNHLHEEIFFFAFFCLLSCSSASCPSQLTRRSLLYGWCGRACAPRLAVIEHYCYYDWLLLCSLSR